MQELNPKKREAAPKPRSPRVSDKPKASKPARPASKKAEQPTLFADDAAVESRERDTTVVADAAPAERAAPKTEKAAKNNAPAAPQSEKLNRSSSAKLASGFGQFGLHETLLAALEAKGMNEPNDTQKQLMPAAILGRDIATTIPQGSGKTAFFLMVAAQRLLASDIARGTAKAPSVLILVNNKDAALQGQSHAGRLLANTGLTATAIFENGDVQRQESSLQQGVDIVFATPARALEFSSKGSLEWSSLSTLMIDDLSELLKGGAGSDTEYLLKSLIKKRLQSVFQSTWWNSWSYKMAETYLLKPLFIGVKKGAEPQLVNIQHSTYVVPAEQKFQVLLGTLRDEKKFTIVFVNSKIVADWVGYKLATNGAKVEVCLNPPAPERKADIVKAADEGKLHTLVVVEGALADMKFAKTTNVINFDVPDSTDAFLKRAELTKSQTAGHYFTIVCDDYGHNMVAIESDLEQPFSARAVPAEYLKIEDKSDFPFDETGRVKAIPNNLRVIAAPVVTPAPAPVQVAPERAPAAASAAPAQTQKPAFQPRPIDRVADTMPVVPLVASDAPQPPVQHGEPRRTPHQAGGQPQGQQFRQRENGDGSFQPRHAGPRAEGQQASGSYQGQKPYQKSAQGGGYQQGNHQYGGQQSGHQHRSREERFDERARETAEAAREAARQAAGGGQAAAPKHKPARMGYERPEGGIVDLAAETLSTAVELVQLRMLEALEDAFVPPLSRLLERLREARDRRLRR